MAVQAISAVLWGMDVTLIDSEPTWIQAPLDLVEQHHDTWTYTGGSMLVDTDMEVTSRAFQNAGGASPRRHHLAPDPGGSHGKPHPEPYLAAARKLGVDPQRCVAIEDSPTALAAALAAGTIAIGVPP